MAKLFLPNPGFELGDRDWTLFTGSTIIKDATNARSGSWVCQNLFTQTGPRSEVFAIRPGLKITGSALWKHTANYDQVTKTLIQWFDKDNVFVNQSIGNLIAAGTTVYTQSQILDAIAPDRTKSFAIRLVASNISTIGTAWVDDADATGDIIESIPATATLSSYRIVPADTVGVFDPLLGTDKFTEFNAGMSDKWSGVYSFTPQILGGDMNALLAFLRRIGRTERFFAYDPDRKTPVNGVVNGMTVDGATTNGTNKIPVKAGPVSSTALVAGDYIEVKDQYFQLQRDLEIGPEGTGQAIVFPAVRSTLADGEDIITNNPKMVARITSDLEWTRKAGDFTAPSISFEEV